MFYEHGIKTSARTSTEKINTALYCQLQYNLRYSEMVTKIHEDYKFSVFTKNKECIIMRHKAVS